MKVIVHINIDDDERNKIATALDGHESKRMVSRAEIKEVCANAVGTLLNPEGSEDDNERSEIENIEPSSFDWRKEPGFTPSRGDESYLYKPKNSELAAACSAILDGLEFVESFAWEQLERNRE